VHPISLHTLDAIAFGLKLREHNRHDLRPPCRGLSEWESSETVHRRRVSPYRSVVDTERAARDTWARVRKSPTHCATVASKLACLLTNIYILLTGRL
jgi:hypothetical protein